MPFLKKGCRWILAGLVALLSLAQTVFPVAAAGFENESMEFETSAVSAACHLSGEQIVAQIEETYAAVKTMAGRSSFQNRCSSLVNYSTVALGLQSQLFSCHGKNEYDQYLNLDRTDRGYDVVRYSAEDYTLEEALNAISDDGTWDAYNIIIGWQGGNTSSSSAYGHTCFIHAIIDGYVYFYESYGLEIDGVSYREGQPIVCTIEQFARYYDYWAFFEGAVHLDFHDSGAPVLSEITATDVSKDGFTLSFEAADDIAITDIGVKVWTYGNNRDSGAKTLPVNFENGIATVRVETADFGGFDGRYYASCYAEDHAGNTAVNVLEGWVDLYTAEPADGIYQVVDQQYGAHNAPYTSVNGADTLEYTLEVGSDFPIVGSTVNAFGETWYQMEDGNWIAEDSVKRQIQWREVWKYLGTMLASVMPGTK